MKMKRPTTASGTEVGCRTPTFRESEIPFYSLGGRSYSTADQSDQSDGRSHKPDLAQTSDVTVALILALTATTLALTVLTAQPIASIRARIVTVTLGLPAAPTFGLDIEGLNMHGKIPNIQY